MAILLSLILQVISIIKENLWEAQETVSVPRIIKWDLFNIKGTDYCIAISMGNNYLRKMSDYDE